MDDKVTVTPVYPPGYPPAPPPPRRSGFAGCVALGATIALGLSLLMNLLLLGAKASGDQPQGPTSLHEKVIEGEGEDKIVQITVEGVIADKTSTGLFGATGESLVKRVKDELERAKKDDFVKAVILEVDSPGGTVSASDEIYNYLVKFRDSAKKPLVIHQGGMAASGGYYISAAGDRIIVEPTCITGSIGVIMQGLNVAGFLNSHGVVDNSITSGPNKDLLSMTKPPSEEHRKILQATVDDMYERFCTVVADGIAHRTGKKRDDVMADVKKLADGRIYTAQQAIDLKLADKMGYIEDAFAEAMALAKTQKARLVKYTKQPSFFELLSGNQDASSKIKLGGVDVNVDAGVLDDLRTPRMMMIWRGD